eukprot:284091-Pyramimonas_sp.AAC.1
MRSVAPVLVRATRVMFRDLVNSVGFSVVSTAGGREWATFRRLNVPGWTLGGERPCFCTRFPRQGGGQGLVTFVIRSRQEVPCEDRVGRSLSVFRDRGSSSVLC